LDSKLRALYVESSWLCVCKLKALSSWRCVCKFGALCVCKLGALYVESSRWLYCDEPSHPRMHSNGILKAKEYRDALRMSQNCIGMYSRILNNSFTFPYTHSSAFHPHMLIPLSYPDEFLRIPILSSLHNLYFTS